VTTYTVQLSRQELGILIDALETWPSTKPDEITLADEMAQTFQRMYDRDGSL
jgi:hypothetical protein